MRATLGGLLVWLGGCDLEHHAPLHTAELPPLAPSVLHANKLWIAIADEMPESACVAPEDRRLLCFEHLRSTVQSALARSLWMSFPGVAAAPRVIPTGDYLLRVDLLLEALPPDAKGPGWSAGVKGTWRLERDGQLLDGQGVASRSRADFAYGAPLGAGASEVIDAIAVRIGMSLGAFPESRMPPPVPLPEVATSPLFEASPAARMPLESSKL